MFLGFRAFLYVLLFNERWTDGKVYFLLLVGVNVWTFCVFGFDKYCARSGRRRVPESRLLCLVWHGGSLGAWVAMWVFRHKTLHKKFKYGVPSVWLLQLLVVVILWYAVGMEVV